MPNRLMIVRSRCLILVFMLIIANGAGIAHADSTPVPASSDAMVLECLETDPTCEGDGALVEFLASGESVETEMAWSLARVTLQPDVTVQPGGGEIPTHYTVYVEEGTVGLTASVPVVCVGECRVDLLASDATPEALSTGGVLIPAGSEVILSAGDVATFGGSSESEHVYRNAGETEAEFVSNLSGPTSSVRCKGRCLNF